jgi:hypothetical protein
VVAFDGAVEETDFDILVQASRRQRVPGNAFVGRNFSAEGRPRCDGIPTEPSSHVDLDIDEQAE